MKLKQNLWERLKKDIYSLNLKRVNIFFFYIFILILPTQLAIHFWPDWAFILGIRVDYLAPAIYLSDILLFLVLTIWFIKSPKLPRFLLPLILFAILNIAISVSWQSSLFKWIKVVEFSLLGFYVSQNKFLFKTKTFFKVFSISLLTISIIGILQFLLGRTLGGLLYYLGERTFNINTPGIALENILGKVFMRPYSIFSHPNSLAGYIFLSLLFFLRVEKVSYVFSLIVGLLSGSVSSFVGFISSRIFKKAVRFVAFLIIVTGIILPLVKFSNAPVEILERQELNKIASGIIANNFWTGSGLNTFVYQNRLLQPVHNIYLLLLSEIGIFGLVFFTWVILKIIKKHPGAIIFILVTGLVDHYWLTLQQNMLLFSIVIGLLI